jgi:hypothetical protein
MCTPTDTEENEVLSKSDWLLVLALACIRFLRSIT